MVRQKILDRMITSVPRFNLFFFDFIMNVVLIYHKVHRYVKQKKAIYQTELRYQ